MSSRTNDKTAMLQPGGSVIQALSAEELAMTAENYFASFPWDGAPPGKTPLDPDTVPAETFLGAL